MTPYFKSILAFMFIFVIVGIMFDGLNTPTGTGVTIFISILVAIAVWLISTRIKR